MVRELAAGILREPWLRQDHVYVRQPGSCATREDREAREKTYIDRSVFGGRGTAFTLNVYAHVLPDMGDAAAYAMDDVLG